LSYIVIGDIRNIDDDKSVSAHVVGKQRLLTFNRDGEIASGLMTSGICSYISDSHGANLNFHWLPSSRSCPYSGRMAIIICK